MAGENGRVPSRATEASVRRAADTPPGPGDGAAPVVESRGVRGALASWWGLWGPHVRRFAPTVLVSHAVTLAVAIALAVIVGIGETFTAVPAMVGSFWMVANLAPVEFTGAQLGIVPLLPALLIVLVHSRRIRAACGTRITVRNIRVFAVLAVGVPMLLTVLAWLVLWDASKVFAIAPPNLAVALLSTALLNGFVFVLGLGPKIWRALLLRRGLPTWPVESVRLAGIFVRWMLVAGLVALLVQLVFNISVFTDAYSIAPDAWGRIGLSVLSVLYVPNLAVGAAGILMGSEMHVGDASASLFAVTNANLPPLPVLAALPHSGLRFGELLLVVPAVVALVIVHRFFTTRTFVESPVFTALGAGVASGVLGLLVSLAAGGTLGVYGAAGPLLWLTPLVFACWLVVPALLVFAWVQRQGARVRETAADAVDDPEAGEAGEYVEDGEYAEDEDYPDDDADDADDADGADEAGAEYAETDVDDADDGSGDDSGAGAGADAVEPEEEGREEGREEDGEEGIDGSGESDTAGDAGDDGDPEATDTADATVGSGDTGGADSQDEPNEPGGHDGTGATGASGPGEQDETDVEDEETTQ
ncbi:DUF6350 family protein [Corynebacteriaceae bacterium 7-707]